MRKSKLKNIPFKTKLFLSLGTVLLTLSLIVCIFFSRTSIRNAMNNDKTSMNIVLERISTQINELYEQMNIAATSITKNPTLKSVILKLNTADAGNAELYVEQTRRERTIQTALGNMMFSPIISNVILYNQDRGYFYYSGTYYDDMDYVYDRLEKLTLPNPADTLISIYKPPHQSDWTTDERMVLSVLRNFSDMTTTQDTIVEIQVPVSLMDAICTQDSFESQKEVMILDQSGNIVYPYNKEISSLPAKTVKQIQKQISSGKSRDYTYSYSYSAMKSETTGLTMVLLSNNTSIREQVISYIFTTIIVLILTLALTLLIIFTLITQMTRPLNELISYVNELSLDSDTKLKLPADSFNEFELLNTSMNQMVTNLKASIQEIYELQIRESMANLAALQAQVDPHFLYNALNSISAASEVYDSEVTTEMCQELSSMMRYVTSKKTEVHLIEELTHTKNYLEFMKISNGTNFNYQIEVSPELHTLLIPKLSIQPFAENSFRHGFKNTLPPWNFSIVCRAEKDQWEILITDNGGGFSKEALNQISTAPVAAAGLEINGLGLNNTFSRLALHFGSSFTYQVVNLTQGSQIILKGVFHHD
ncbi:histidine kinase [Faecalicatena sp. AGMB00832]|uniref:Histidine kinase n=1 Tax=Faecalicatena faecalis TaxID=2726362 RepID=A0ABS6D4Q5_9FIRM|nr:histidine kinase [Faecalicatena faecalis]MBU3876310.1 histidine kinase [Faecalicatena faecalis]